MGKPKKGKKGRKDEDFSDDDGEIDVLAETEKTAEPAADSKPAQGKKGKKARRKKDDDWEDDVSAEIAALSLQQNPQGSDEEKGNEAEISQPKPKKKEKKKKKVDSDDDAEEMPAQGKNKKASMSAFMMLDVDDQSEEEILSEEEVAKPAKKQDKKKQRKQTSIEEPEEDEDMDDAEGKQQTQQKGKKKKGKQKNKKEEEEEDFDAILAEFGAAPEKKEEPSEGKKKKKGKKEKEKFEERVETPEEEDGGFEMVKDVSEMTEEELMKHMGLDDDDEDDKKKKKKGKKQKEQAPAAEAAEEEEDGEKAEDDEEDAEGESSVKSAAQKKKEKKERQKQKKLEEAAAKKKKGGKKEAEPAQAEGKEEAGPAPVVEDKPEGAEVPADEDAAEGESKKKKKDRKKKGEEKEEKKKKPSKMALALQEMIKKQKEEEERLQREEDEKERILEEKLKAKEEKERIEREKKEKVKQKKKEKIDKQKAEGTYMTAKQKEAQRIAQAKLKAQGIEIPSATDKPEGEKKKRVVYDSRPKKKRQQQQEQPTTPVEEPKEPATVELEVKNETPAKEAEQVVDSWEEAPEEDVKDEWDLSDEEEEQKEEPPKPEKTAVVSVKKQASTEEEDEEEDDEDDDDEDSDEEDESDEDESDSESDSDDGLTVKERARERGMARIQKRKDDAEKKKTVDDLRAPVVVVLGHVDTGKTKLLDKLRRTNVQDGEAGGITQQIGATNVPEGTIKEQTKMCKEFAKKELRIPGLLIIDTPGHESFSNLRSRGSSLCDIAILVVDIMHGLEPQTIESINLLKSRKTPFIVALNKIDRLFGWQPNPHTDVVNTLKKQKPNTKIEFEERAQLAIVQLAEQGLNASLFYENKNPREYISLVPTSAHSGDGMGNLIALICDLSQSMLAKRLAYSEELAATVMEVKALPGLGTTIDVILVNGSIKEGATIIAAGQEGTIVTQVRGLLMPQPLKELRVKGAYEHVKELKAAQGVKIIAKDLDKALAGLPLYVAHQDDEIDIYREELEEQLEDILGSIKLTERGVFVQASTLGSLEALLEFLRTSKIPYAGINIGPVHKKDIMKASVMLEHDTQYAVILAFDVKVEREAQEMADSLGVKIFTADIIYHLFDAFMAFRENLKKKKQEEFKHIAVFPCKVRVIPAYVFNSRDPIVCGVVIEAGFLKIGSPLCVPTKEFVELGRVTSIEVNHKPIEKALKGQEVCIKIEPLPSDTPKMFGRHFDENDILFSRISRESIDAVKNYFREEMGKNDWQLMIEMKKVFEII